MYSTPNIAVITVCFNCENEIEKTIESVYAQKSIDYEYIIQDGNSMDDTVKRAERFKSLFAAKNISFSIYSQKDMGIYHAMNLAAAKCRAKYLLFLNAGDTLCHDNVFHILDIANKMDDTDVFYGDSLMVDGDNIRLFKADMQLISYRMPFAHQACFVSRELFMNQMYNLKYLICADYDLVLNLHEKQCSFQYLNTIVCKYDMSGISSSSFVKKRKEHEKILREHKLNSGKLSFVIHMAEAYMKTILNAVLPRKILICFRKIYMDKVKHYKYWAGEIY